MLDEHALRYLLTRQIWELRNTVPAIEYEEVSRSLQVTRDKTDYRVAWSHAGHAHETRIPRLDYVFYRKGDRPDSEGVIGNYEQANLENARALVLEMFAIPGQLQRFNAAPIRIQPAERITFVWNAIFCGALAIAGNTEVRVFAALLLLALWIEYVPRFGRLCAACALVPIAIAGPPLAGAVLAALYACVQFLDPNWVLRNARIGVAAAATAIGVIMFTRNTPDIITENVLVAAALFALIIPVAILRWTIGAHFRTLPLIIGFAAPALALEAHTIPAAIVTVNIVLGLAARMWGWRLFPHPNARTFQGVSRVSRQ